MGKPKTEAELQALKKQTEDRLKALKEASDLCLTNLDNIRTRILNATTDTESGPGKFDSYLGSDLEAFYEKTKDNVADIKKAADALDLNAPTAQAIKKLETAVDRALKDYAAHDAHLDVLARDVREHKDSTKQEMVFIAKQGGLKVGRMLSDLGKSATRFITSWLKSTKEETARIQQIHATQTTGPEGVARAMGGAVETGARATGRAAGELGAALGETASDAKEFLEDATPESAKKVLRKASELYTKAKAKVAGVIPDEVKAVAETASNVVSSGISAASNAVSSVPSVAPVLPALKSAAENLQKKLDDHNDGILQSLRSLEELRTPKGQPIVNAQKQQKPPKAHRTKNPKVEKIREKNKRPRPSQSEY